MNAMDSRRGRTPAWLPVLCVAAATGSALREAAAANITTRVAAFYGSYRMGGLHALQQGITDEFRAVGIEPGTFGSFPPWVNVQIQILEGPSGGMGFFYDFASTGSRVHYSDYSGELRADMTVFRVACGPMAEFPLSRGGGARGLRGFTQAALHFSVLRVRQGLVLNGVPPFRAWESGTSRVAGLSLRLGASRPVRLAVRTVLLTAAYELDLALQSLPYRDMDGEKLKCDWSGWRVGAAVSLTEG